MNVHIHGGWIHFEEEEADGIASPHESGVVAFNKSVVDGPAVHGTIIDEAIKLAAVGTAEAGFTDESLNADTFTRKINGKKLVGDLRAMQGVVAAKVAAGARRPTVYFEEWDSPHISAIRWVSELIAIAGGEDCFPELAAESLGKNRIIADGTEIVRRNPDIILGSWCGKKFRPEAVVAREGWGTVNAVRHQQLFEIKSPDILQPGPAAVTDGVQKMHEIILRWMDAEQAGAFTP